MDGQVKEARGLSDEARDGRILTEEKREEKDEKTELSNSFTPLPPTDALAMPLNLKHKGTGIHRIEGLDSSDWNYSNLLFQFLSPQERRNPETRYWKEWEFNCLSPQERRKELERKKEETKFSKFLSRFFLSFFYMVAANGIIICLKNLSCILKA